MAEFCVFCGTELKWFGKNTLVCGNATQPVCKDCWEKYRGGSQVERCRELLTTGRAVDPETIRAFLEKEERELAEKQAKRERLGQAMNCCGQPMTSLGVSEFQLGRQGWILGDLPNLVAGAMELGVFRCEQCGQIKFMDPQFMK